MAARDMSGDSVVFDPGFEGNCLRLEAFVKNPSGLTLDPTTIRSTVRRFQELVDELHRSAAGDRYTEIITKVDSVVRFPTIRHVHFEEHVQHQGESDIDCVRIIRALAFAIRADHSSPALDTALNATIALCRTYLGVQDPPTFANRAGAMALVTAAQAARSRAALIVNRMPAGEGKEHKAALILAMKVPLGLAAKAANELPHYQMDFAGAITAPLLSLASGLVDRGMDVASGKLKQAFGVDHDSRSIMRIDAGHLAVNNVPREVATHAFKAHDRMTDQSENFSQARNVDICDLKARMQIPSRLSAISWATTNVVGDDILTSARFAAGFDYCEVSPMPCAEYIITTGPSRRQKFHTMPSLIAMAYERWRGSMVFTIEVIPTKFHQGQLYIAFQPWTNDNITNPPTLSQARNCIGATVDLSMTNRTKLVIPYNSTREYLGCSYQLKNGGPECSLGRLHIFVQNPLTCPPTVAQSIAVNVWVSVGDDFEFVIPREIVDELYLGLEWQGKDGEGYSEVIQETKLAAPVGLQPAGHMTQTDRQVLPACNVKPADLITVVNREYLLATGVTWTTSMAYNTPVISTSIGQLFSQAPLAIRGLLDYHNYFRGDFEFTLKMNANPFLAGMLVMYYWPARRTPPTTAPEMREHLPSVTQLAHAFFTPASDTNVSIRVPWTNIQRVIRTNNLGNNTRLGTLIIAVYNPLQTGVGGPNTLTGSIWGRIVDPYVGFKKADISVAAVMDVAHLAKQQGGEDVTPVTETGVTPAPLESGESRTSTGVKDSCEGGATASNGDDGSSDSAKKTASGGLPIPMLAKPVSGFILTSHMNAKELLRRPDWVISTSFTATASRQDLRVLALPVGVEGAGKMHKFIKALYHAWSGSMRYSFTATAGMSQNMLMHTLFDPTAVNLNINAAQISTTLDFSYDSTNFWRPSQTAMTTVSIPFYADFPTLLTVGRDPPTVDNFNGNLDVNVNATNPNGETTGVAMDIHAFESIGDDYELYVPMPCMTTRDQYVPTIIKQQGRETDQESVFRQIELEFEEKLSQIEHQGLWSGFKAKFEPMMAWVRRKLQKRVGKEIVEGLEATFKWIMTSVLPAMTWALDFILNIHVICTSWDSAAKMMAMTAIAMKCLIGYHWGDQLLKQLKEVFDVHLEGGDYSVVAGSLAAAVVAGLIGLLGYGVATQDASKIRNLTIWKVSEGAACVSKLASGVKAAPGLWESCKTGLQTALGFVLGGDETFADWHKANEERLRTWQQQTDLAYTENCFDNNNIFKCTKGINNFELLLSLVKVAREVNVHAPGIKFFPTTYLLTAKRLLATMARAQKAFDGAVGRVEPVGIFVEGSAGCGKSYTWTKIMPYLIMKKAGLVQNYREAQKQTWSRPTDPNQQYMDGYASQKWVSCDDFMAGIEDLDALQMINLISVAACPLNMADLEEKRTTFDSSFVCATTNQKSVNIVNAVRDKDALIRRFPFAYHMTVRERFQKDGKMDLPKVRRFLDQWVDNPVQFNFALSWVWRFRKLDLKTGNIEGQVRLNQIIEDIVDMYQLRTKTDREVDAMLYRLQGKETLEVPAETFSLQRHLSWEENEIRIFPGEQYHDAVTDCFKESGVSRSRAYISYMMDAWKLQSKGMLDYTLSQGILRSIKADIERLGWSSWEEFLETAGGLSPAEKASSYCYISDGSREKFAKFVIMLSLVPRQEGQKVVRRWRGLQKMAVSAAKIAGVAVVLGIAIKLVKVIFDKIWMKVTQQGPQYDSGGKRQPMKKPGTRASVRQAMGVRQGNDNVNLLSIQKAMRAIRLVGDKSYDMNCIAIDTKTLLLPHHFYEKYIGVVGNCTVQLEKMDSTGKPIGWTTINMDRANVEKIEELSYHAGKKDVIVLRLIGAVCQHARNIRSLIVNRKTKTSYSGSELAAYLLSPEGYDERIKAVLNFKDHIDYHGDLAIPGKTSEVTMPGDCGRPYVLQNKAAHRPLVGFHVLGIGYGTCQIGMADFSIEAIEDAERVIDSRINSALNVEPWAVQEIGGEVAKSRVKYWKKETDVIGPVVLKGTKLERHQPVSTAFCLTKLQHPDWFDDYAPTEKTEIVGSDGQKLHPLYTNSQKFESNIVMPPRLKHHRMIINFMKAKMGVGVDARALTEFEMINGFNNMSAIILNTGCGYIQPYYKNGKTELFEQLDQEETDEGEMEKLTYNFSDVAHSRKIPILDAAFVEHLQQQELRIVSGEPLQTFWVATNKDELISKAKVKIGKTRVFVQPGLELTLLTRKYFGHFIDAYKARAGFNLCHAIGTDKDAQWGEYYKGLKQVGDFGFDVDYTNYDGSVHQHAIEAFLEVVDNYYGPEDRQVRACIVDSIVNSKIIVGKEVIQKGCGNCSGSPITDVYNSVTNWYNVLLVYIMARNVADLSDDFDKFDEEVRAVTYGDDVLVSATDECLDYGFTREFFREVMLCVGMTVTSADKSDKIIPFEPLEDLTFLKSSFVQRNGYVAAPLPVKVIHRELRWQKKVNDGDATIMKQKVDVALRMMAHHGEDAVKELLDQLQECKYPATFDFEMWEWDMRSKQELANIDHVWLVVKPEEVYFLADEDELRDAYNFEADFDFE